VNLLRSGSAGFKLFGVGTCRKRKRRYRHIVHGCLHQSSEQTWRWRAGAVFCSIIRTFSDGQFMIFKTTGQKTIPHRKLAPGELKAQMLLGGV
jgi:hypothetical protein